MRRSWSANEHQEAVSRRLALLAEELAVARSARESVPEAADPYTPDTHTRIRRLDVPGGGPEQWREPGEAPVEFPGAFPGEFPGGEWAAAGEPPGPAPRPVPVPGRHAARAQAGAPQRPAAVRTFSWSGLRVAIGPAQLSVLLVAVCAALAVTCWWVLRAQTSGAPVTPITSAPALVADPVSADGVSPVAASVSASPGAEGSSGSAGSQVVADPSRVVVDVAGKVRHPGIVVLPSGSRVADALKAAGGPRRGVDLTPLNLARVLVDGEQIVVGVAAPPGVAATVTPGSGVPGALVNLNSADQATLESLPQVGPVTAQAIIGWREAHGGFTAIDQLLDVDGIGEATLNQIAPLVTV